MIELVLISLAAFILLYPQVLEGYLRAVDLINGRSSRHLQG